MSDGRNRHAGILRSSMAALVEALRNDPVMIENDVEVVYRLDHPSKQIESGLHRLSMRVEPAGISQTRGAGTLDLQYYSWLVLKCKPSQLGHDEEDSLSYLSEYVADMLHRKIWGGMSTFVSRILFNYKSCTLQSNHRTVNVKLEEDEIAAVIWVWQSPKSIEQIDEDGTEEFESATTVKIEGAESEEQ